VSASCARRPPGCWPLHLRQTLTVASSVRQALQGSVAAKPHQHASFAPHRFLACPLHRCASGRGVDVQQDPLKSSLSGARHNRVQHRSIPCLKHAVSMSAVVTAPAPARGGGIAQPAVAGALAGVSARLARRPLRAALAGGQLGHRILRPAHWSQKLVGAAGLLPSCDAGSMLHFPDHTFPAPHKVAHGEHGQSVHAQTQGTGSG